ncbi:efflux transporter outer membrane subunit [Uliginosibacterium sediminicola]|uniref:Efflux transporter outer membrane subunit n=1 Tax=Uliginosibacterium sediminicola TaxID=2024550 RepID=A0ABU9YUU5_9RHOO
MTLRPLPLALLLALSLSACTTLGIHSSYTTPAAQIAPQWQYAKDAPSGNAVAVTQAWWQAFGDPALNALIQQSLARNNDLAAATLKLQRARLQAGLSAEALTPTLSGSLGTSTQSSLREQGSTSRSASAQLQAAWEIDLWNKLGSQRDASNWEAQASAQDRESTALSLSGSMARLYWQQAYLAERIRHSEDSVAYAQRTLDLVRSKQTAGAASGLDTLQAEQSLASQQASHTQLIQQRNEALNSLALLLDGDAPVAPLPAQLPQSALPAVDAGLPASLLANRPDLRAAELRLRSTLATADATRASLYPALTLTGTLGSSSDTLRHVMENPLGSLASNLSLPFLQWTTTQLNIKVAQADYDIAVVNFRQTLYTALGDVNNALSARQQYAAQAQALQTSLKAAREIERLYEVRYRAGGATLQSWLDAQETRRTAENALAENHYNRLSNHVSLVLALGGSATLDAP